MNSLLQNPITPAVRSFGASGGYVSRVGNNLVLAPDSGNQVYLYKGSSWVPFAIPDAGITTPCVGLPFAGDCCVYCYESGGVLQLEVSQTAPTTQNGLLVKTGAIDRLLVARAFAWPTDITTTGQAISGGDYNGSYVKGYAFDNVEMGVTPYCWISSQSGSGLSGIAYIGQDFGTAKNIRAVRHVAFQETQNVITSMKVQYSDDNSNWYDATTFTLTATPYLNTFVSVPNCGAHRYWRLLANSNLAGGTYWAIPEIEMGEGSEILVYGSAYNAATDYSKHMLCNVYNKRSVGLRRVEPTATWTYTAQTWRAQNNNAANRIDVVTDGKDAVVVRINGSIYNSNDICPKLGVGLDSVVTEDGAYTGNYSRLYTPVISNYNRVLTAGKHSLTILEWSTASGTTYWYGTNAGDAPNYPVLAGMIAEIQA